MKNLLIALVAVSALVACGNSSTPSIDPFEQGTVIVKKATEDIKNAKNNEEVADIMQGMLEAMASLENSDEMKAYMLLFENNDTVAMGEFEQSKKDLDVALNEFSFVLAKTCQEFSN